MSCVKVTADFQEIDVGDSLDTWYKTDFFFNIPEFLALPSDEECSRYKLPPSIRVMKSARHMASGNCDVIYNIEARVLRLEKQVCSSSREVIIIPATRIPPPLDPESLQKEYQLAAEWTLGSPWSSKKSITVLASSMEPPPLVFPTNKGEYGSTKALLNLKTRAITGKDMELMGYRLSECEAVINLEAVTYFLGREEESVMSVAEALQSPLVVLKKTAYKKERRKIQLGAWRKSSKITHGPSPTFEWETSISLPIILPEEFSSLPSFFSTLVVRRYAINVEIFFESRRSIVPHKPVVLRIPVQIVHASNNVEKCMNTLPEERFDNLKAPAYVA
ncbi:hypothetical protein OIDMADRAFT_55793 [Oidiodendron maius Zn]|uniref:Arrestin C-terminal-like domain-containing protein n=1 Tax=Oidiodendron maius (strain Zn) TaxID=913774 RepID=A0A0C3GUX5_OIDMZ|nr:hypothetical protein OIDMADRAFT_55793 [Oidiodendron maius Zn]